MTKKGYKQTKEHKRKIGIANKGKIRSEKYKENLRKINTGKKYSDEINRKKVRPGKLNGMYGKKRPDLALRNKLNPLSGCKNPSWIDGRSFIPYSPEFNKRKKQEIKLRDNYVCQLCGEKIFQQTKNKFLTIHHIDYNKKNNENDNLIALCNFCNSSVNTSRDKWMHLFKEKIQEMR